MAEEQPATASTWHPACPSCDRTTTSVATKASGRRNAVSDLVGTQATCSGCGETFTVDGRTRIRKA